jgi:Flp pilus assembly protein TadD
MADDERRRLLRLEARAAVAEGDAGEAVKALEEAVALDPLDGDALLLLGQHHARAGDADRALIYYERAASLEAFEATAKVRQAQVLVGQARYHEALPLLRRAQEIRPQEEVARYLEQVERAARTQQR